MVSILDLDRQGPFFDCMGAGTFQGAMMRTEIAKIVEGYEQGSLSRRELIEGLMMVFVASGSALAAESTIRVNRIHHVSIHVSDLQRSVKFYREAFGLRILNEDKKTQTVRLVGGTGWVVIRQGSPAGVVDHFALGIDHMDEAAITREMQAHGISPKDTGEPLGFHVVDPDGFPVQMISTSA
jgi:catechol 2,3-dioxygenase-like lactoylglutathione lyase family enzyme